MIAIADAHRRNIEQMIDELAEKRDAFLPHDPLSAAGMQKEIDALEFLLLHLSPRTIN